jgi:hypothetical protein
MVEEQGDAPTWHVDATPQRHGTRVGQSCQFGIRQRLSVADDRRAIGIKARVTEEPVG